MAGTFIQLANAHPDCSNCKLAGTFVSASIYVANAGEYGEIGTGRAVAGTLFLRGTRRRRRRRCRRQCRCRVVLKVFLRHAGSSLRWPVGLVGPKNMFCLGTV